MKYAARFTPRFGKKLVLYSSLRKRIQKEVDRILTAPYEGTERLVKTPQGLNLKGCRSARAGQNFRIIFVICEECIKEPECLYCECDGLTGTSVVFLNIGPHDKAYAMK